MKRGLCALWALVLVCCSGCAALPKSRDPGSMELITVMGVDVTETGMTRITLLGGQQSFENGSEQPRILTAEALTPAAAARSALLSSEKRLFPGNMEYVLIGKAAAEQSVAPILDYLLRDNDIRPVIRLCLVEGDAGQMICDYASGAGLSDRLGNLFRVGREQSVLFTFTLAQAAAAWYAGQPLVMPVLSGSGGTLLPDGGAVLYRGRLRGRMDRQQTRGYMLLTGASHGHPLEIGEQAFDVRDASVEMKPVIRDGAVTGLTLSLKFELSLIQSDMDTSFSRSSWEEKACKREEDCIRSVILFSRQLGLEFFGFGEKLRAFHPIVWSKTEQNWQSGWQQLAVTVETNAKFDRTFDLWEGK